MEERELKGLTDGEAADLKARGLSNAVPRKCSKSYWDIIRDNVFTFFNALLAGIAVCFIVFGVGNFSKYGFCINLFLNTAIGIFQEVRSKKAVEKLSIVCEAKVPAIRSGREIKINSDDVVLGDLIVIEAGAQIPADGKVVSGSIEANESLLTGESDPIRKGIGGKLLAGSFAVSGRCVMEADAVGQGTYAAGIQSKAKEFKRAKSELMTVIMRLLKILACIIVPLGAALGVKLWATNGMPDAYSTAFESEVIIPTGTMMVGMIPSGMILLTSVALAVGIVKLASKKALVQDMYSIEMLSRVDTVAFDKTGTLTDGRMDVDSVQALSPQIMKGKALSSSLASFLGSFSSSNATSSALIARFGSASDRKADSILEFSSARKVSSALMPDGWVYVLGAPEFMTSDKNIISGSSDLASKGLRVVLFSRRKGSLRPEGEDAGAEWQHLALISLRDGVRPTVGKTMRWFSDNGVDVKIISGDNPRTVSQIAHEAGVAGWDRAVSMEGVGDADIPGMASRFSVFGRVSPEQKAKIIKALQAQGHKVAYAGDGVNDVISLKTADCSVAMAGGADAAKAVSNIVLIDSDFDDLPAAIGEGRRVVNNITRTSTLFLMKTFSMMMLGLLTLVGVFSAFPLEMENLALMETFVIGIASFLLSVEPNQDRLTGSFSRNIMTKALPAALLLAGSVLIGRVWLSGGQPWLADSSGMRGKTLVCMLYSVASFVVLFRICAPMNGYRAGVCAGNLFGAVMYSIFLPLSAFGGRPTTFFQHDADGNFLFWAIDVSTEGKPIETCDYATSYESVFSHVFDLTGTLSALGSSDWMFVAGCILAMPVVYYAADALFARLPQKGNKKNNPA
jgi:cation-transporting P-type ATPase E